MCARQCAVDARHQYFDGRDDDDARGVCLIRSLEMVVVWTSSHLTSGRHVRTGPLVDAEKHSLMHDRFSLHHCGTRIELLRQMQCQ